MEKRGNITHFNVSVNKVENPWDTFNDTTRYFEVPSDAFEFSLFGLDNYTEYNITISAYTAVGAGPAYHVTFRTATNSKLELYSEQFTSKGFYRLDIFQIYIFVFFCLVPTGPPTIWYASNITSSSLNIKWDLLKNSLSEGPLQGYVIYFRLTDEHLVCTFYENCTYLNSTTTNETTTEINLLDLAFWSNYTVWMAAFTEAGLGPESEQIMVMTDSYGTIISNSYLVKPFFMEEKCQQQ